MSQKGGLGAGGFFYEIKPIAPTRTGSAQSTQSNASQSSAGSSTYLTPLTLSRNPSGDTVEQIMQRLPTYIPAPTREFKTWGEFLGEGAPMEIGSEFFNLEVSASNENQVLGSLEDDSEDLAVLAEYSADVQARILEYKDVLKKYWPGSAAELLNEARDAILEEISVEQKGFFKHNFRM